MALYCTNMHEMSDALKSKLKNFKPFDQIELHNQPVLEVGTNHATRAYGIAWHSRTIGWNVWKPYQTESELDDIQLTREQAIGAFNDLVSKAYLSGYRFIIST